MVFEIGQEVLRCQPFAYSIFTEYLSSVCDFCLKFKLDEPALKLQKCSGCKVLFYCSTACQKKAWASHHKWECKCIGKMSKIGLFEGNFDDFRMMCRVILKLKNGGHKIYDTLPNGQKVYYEDLMSHIEDLENRPHFLESIENFMHPILQDCLGDEKLTKEFVAELFGKLTTNQLHMCGKSQTGARIGKGLFLGVSKLDHSCAPNAVASNTNNENRKEMVVRCTSGKIEHFSDLRISYMGDLHKCTQDRRTKLEKNYYFLCDCSVCLDEDIDKLKSSLICSQCKGCVPISSAKCVQCQEKTQPSRIEEYSKSKAEIESLLTGDLEKNVDKFEQVYQDASKICHAYDSTYMNFMFVYLNLGPQNSYTLMKLIRKMLKNQAKTLPEFHINTAEISWRASKILFENGKFVEAKGLCQIAEEQHRTIYGENYSLVAECKNLLEQIDSKIKK